MRHKKSTLICFTGIDGSGKTTLARALVAGLETKGFGTRYVYGRLQPIILWPVFLVGRVLLLHRKDMYRDYVGYSQAKKGLLENRVLSAVYECLVLFDYFFQVTMKIRLPLAIGRDIVCDRYVYDTVITDLAVDLNYPQWRIDKALRRYLWLFPKPDLVFLIDVPEGIANQRKDDVPSVKYLEERRKLYLQVGHEHGMTILDGSKGLDELKTAVQSEAIRHLRGDAGGDPVKE
jgi:thymidylate kinase